MTNVLLKGTPHHLDEQKIRECIEGRMDQVLYVLATNAKCNDIGDLREWLAEIKCLDDRPDAELYFFEIMPGNGVHTAKL